MVAVRQDEFERLCKAGLINFGAEKNYAIVNKKKKAKRKKYFVVENRKINTRHHRRAIYPPFLLDF